MERTATALHNLTTESGLLSVELYLDFNILKTNPASNRETHKEDILQEKGNCMFMIDEWTDR